MSQAGAIGNIIGRQLFVIFRQRAACSVSDSPIGFPGMGPRGFKQSIATHRIEPRGYSPDDLKARLLEADARERADTRTELQRFMGEPEPSRSALFHWRKGRK
jgi:hypothetical protein